MDWIEYVENIIRSMRAKRRIQPESVFYYIRHEFELSSLIVRVFVITTLIIWTEQRKCSDFWFVCLGREGERYVVVVYSLQKSPISYSFGCLVVCF